VQVIVVQVEKYLLATRARGLIVQDA